MKTKVCTKCQKRKSLDRFSRQKPGKYHARCKDCHNEYVREHYLSNKSYYLSKAKTFTKKLKQEQLEKVAELKKKPCKDCGVEYPHYIMEYDHVKGTKIDNISNLVGRVGWERLEKEIAKCDLVCANCHRERTFQRQGVA